MDDVAKVSVNTVIGVTECAFRQMEILKAIKEIEEYETIRGSVYMTISDNKIPIYIEIDKEDNVTFSSEHPIADFITDVYNNINGIENRG